MSKNIFAQFAFLLISLSNTPVAFSAQKTHGDLQPNQWLTKKSNTAPKTQIKFGKYLNAYSQKQTTCFIFDRYIVHETTVLLNLKNTYQIYQRTAYGQPQSRECSNGLGPQVLAAELQQQEGLFQGLITPYLFTEEGQGVEKFLHIYDLTENQRLGSFRFKDPTAGAHGQNQINFNAGFKWVAPDTIQDDNATVPDSYAEGVQPKVQCPPQPSPATKNKKIFAVKKYTGIVKINLKKQTQNYEKIRCEWQVIKN